MVPGKDVTYKTPSVLDVYKDRQGISETSVAPSVAPHSQCVVRIILDAIAVSRATKMSVYHIPALGY